MRRAYEPFLFLFVWFCLSRKKRTLGPDDCACCMSRSVLKRRGGRILALAGGALVIEDLGEGAIDEAALFHLMNLAAEQRAHVLITTRHTPAALAQTLMTRDLASRLRAMPSIGIGAPDDRLLAAVAVKLFADRQITPDEGLLNYILPRVERSIAALRDLVAELDREAMARKRPLTRGLASELLRAREDVDDDTIIDDMPLDELPPEAT